MPAPSSEQGLLLLDVETPATLAHFDRFHDLLSHALRAGGVAEPDRLRCETAIVELLGNLVEHARPRRDGAAVHVHTTISHDVHDARGPALCAELTDDAEPAVVDLDPAVVDDDEAQNGRGLALVRACCDDLAHEASPTGNRWSLRIRCAR